MFFWYLRRLWKGRPLATQRRPVRRARLECETLHARITPAVVINASNQLQIDGTDGADRAVVKQRGADEVEVVFNGEKFRFETTAFDGIVFNGLGGNDRFVNATAESSVADGGAGDDRLIGGSAADTLTGGAGNDRLEGKGGADDLDGGEGIDRVRGDSGRDSCEGGSGNDVVSGQGGADVLTGSGSNDVLSGGDGDDYLDGGDGRDDYRGGRGRDGCNSDDDDAPADENELRVNARGTGGIKVEAEFELEGATSKFKVELEDAAAATTYTVLVDGAVVATLTTDARGDARLTDFSPDFQVAPGATLTVRAGDTVVVQGTFTARLNDVPGDNNNGPRQELQARFRSGALEGRADFNVEPERTRFRAELKGAAANTTYSVLVDGAAVATLTTDGRGEGRLEILNPNFTVAVGSTVQFRNPAGAVLLTATFRPDDDDNDGDDDNGGDDDNSGPGGGGDDD